MASVHGRKRPCTRPVHCGVYEPIWPVHGRIRNTLHGRVRPCRRPVHGRVHGPCTRIHVDTCTRPYTCRVHGRVHGPYMAVYTSRVRGRVRASPPPSEDVRTDGPYTDMCTGGVDGPCARPIHGRVRAVYTARPLHGSVRAVFTGEDVFTSRVHGRRVTAHDTLHRRVHDTLHGRAHGPYAAAQRPSTRTCN